MKKLLVAITLVLMSTQANAFKFGGGDTNNYIKNHSMSKSLSASTSDASASNDGISFEDKLQIPNAPGLSSGSSNTTSKHRKYKQRQVSFILGGWTNIDMDLDIISFLEFYFSQDEVSRVHYNAAACVESAEWRQYRKSVGLSCN